MRTLDTEWRVEDKESVDDFKGLNCLHVLTNAAVSDQYAIYMLILRTPNSTFSFGFAALSSEEDYFSTRAELFSYHDILLISDLDMPGIFVARREHTRSGHIAALCKMDLRRPRIHRDYYPPRVLSVGYLRNKHACAETLSRLLQASGDERLDVVAQA